MQSLQSSAKISAQAKLKRFCKGSTKRNGFKGYERTKYEIYGTDARNGLAALVR